MVSRGAEGALMGRRPHQSMQPRLPRPPHSARRMCAPSPLYPFLQDDGVFARRNQLSTFQVKNEPKAETRTKFHNPRSGQPHPHPELTTDTVPAILSLSLSHDTHGLPQQQSHPKQSTPCQPILSLSTSPDTTLKPLARHATDL